MRPSALGASRLPAARTPSRAPRCPPAPARRSRTGVPDGGAARYHASASDIRIASLPVSSLRIARSNTAPAVCAVLAVRLTARFDEFQDPFASSRLERERGRTARLRGSSIRPFARKPRAARRYRRPCPAFTIVRTARQRRDAQVELSARGASAGRGSTSASELARLNRGVARAQRQQRQPRAAITMMSSRASCAAASGGRATGGARGRAAAAHEARCRQRAHRARALVLDGRAANSRSPSAEHLAAPTEATRSP